jgi:hypothetical protein
MRFFPKKFEPLSNSNKIQIGFIPRIYNSKFRDLWKLDQKEYLLHLKFSAIKPRLEIFGNQEGCVL